MLETWHKPYWDEETYTYDKRLMTSKNYLGFIKSYEYYPNSWLLKKVTDVDGTSMWDKNYVKTTTNFPSSNANSQLNILEDFTYKDGIGRDIANVRKGQGINSTNEDIITITEYDNQGRIARQYEPQLLTSNNGAYQESQSTWKFTQNTFYFSPLNRPHTVTPPDWFTTTYEYGPNEVADGVTIDSTNTVYDANQLFKQVVIDGNDNKSISFNDKWGRTVLVRRTDNNQTTSLNFDTKYIFDDKNREVYSLPPSTNINQKDLLFFSEYDREDRKIREHIPGKAEMRYYYNRQDLLVAKKDGYIEEHPDYRYYVYQDYDGADNPITTTYNHAAYGNSFSVSTTETIDYAGRAKNSHFQANGSSNHIINSKFYDEKEQLIQKLQGSTGLSGNLAWLQKCDYTYLENGLLSKINAANLTGDQRALMECPVALPNPVIPSTSSLDTKDLFYLELAYNTPFAGTSAISQKNGNIVGVKWQVRGREKVWYLWCRYDLR